jgi:UDP-N-acetylmuramyl pentapeptide phosphotransferase/UDP-N-acetylglucosamine-1-phosphate transferase
MILGVLIFILIAIPILFMFRIENGRIAIPTYPAWAYYPLAISLVLACMHAYNFIDKFCSES